MLGILTIFMIFAIALSFLGVAPVFTGCVALLATLACIGTVVDLHFKRKEVES